MQAWQIGAIVGGQLVGLALYFFAPRFWIKMDVAEFNLAGGTKDDNHGTFHRQRLTWRIGFDVVAALVSGAPWLMLGVAPYIANVIGLASIGAGYFFFAFNPGLSLARGLDYVKQYYVSFDPAASWWPDRFLANRAKKAVPWGDRMLSYDESQVIITARHAHAAHELQLLCRWVLVAGVNIYLLGLATSCWLS